MKSKIGNKSDKAMALQVPGTKPPEPIVKEKPPPAGNVRKLVELFENYLKQFLQPQLKFLN